MKASGLKELLAPVGTPECFTVLKGELCYSLSRPDGTPLRDTNPYDAFQVVFSSVNGLLISDPIQFAGYMAFNQPPSHPDPVGTLVTNGTVSVVHTGPYTIYANQLVYFSKFPYRAKNDGGHYEPAVREVGVPGEVGEKDLNGVSLAKFKPALYGLKNCDTAAYLAGVQEEIKTAWFARLGGGSNGAPIQRPLTAENIASEIRSVWAKLDGTLFEHSAKELPARKYAEAFTHLFAYQLHQSTGKDISPFMKYMFQYIQTEFEYKATCSLRYQEALGTDSISFTHPSLNPVIASKFTRR